MRLLAFVLPLGLDSFAVAAAIGATRPAGLTARLRISLVFVLFEAGMPIVGLAAGSGLARLAGTAADYIAAAVVIGIGVWMLVGVDESAAGRLAGVALGLSISMDELAIGFSLGLSRLPTAPVIAAIGAQALLASQLGLALGATVGARFRERAEQLAGVILIVLGCYLVAERALH